MSAFARIWNLGQVGGTPVWTASGHDALPQVSWVASDPDGDTIATHQVRFYDAASAGVKVYDSTALAGNPGFHNASRGMKNLGQTSDATGGPAWPSATYYGPQMWWTLELVDSHGESTGESSRQAFKVDWGQAIYEFNAGTGSSAWDFVNSALTIASTDVAFLFCEADSNGANRGTWQTTIGAAHGAKAYVNILVRLSSYGALTSGNGAMPTLPDMSFFYQSTASQPDNWARSPAASPEHWSIDINNRRYGAKCYRCAVGSAAYHFIEPFRLVAGDGILVAANTDYVFSSFVKTPGPLTANHFIFLQLRTIADVTLKTGQLIGDEFADGPGATSDTTVTADGLPVYSEFWQRLHLHYRTGTETVVRPIVLYAKVSGGSIVTPDNTGDQFWVDAQKFEEGTVVSAWTPGFMSPALTIDSYGVNADGQNGASVSLRKSDGSATATLDRIVDAAAGAYRGNGSPAGVVAAPVGSVFHRLDGGASTSFYVKESGGSTSSGWTAK